MTTGYEEHGMMTPRSRAFYRRIAQGGASLIILGDVSIQPSFAPTPYLFDERFVPGLRQLCEEVHEEGSHISAQLFHQEYDTNEIAVLMKSEGREAAMKKLHEEMENYCNRLNTIEIEVIQGRFVEATLRAKEAGFDMLQIHGDRLVGMFSSGLMNRRSDSYGGPLENRARFAIEVIRKVREAVPDLPIEYKMAIIRTEPPMGKAGPTLDEAKTMAPWLVEVGVSAFHVSLANHGSIGDTIPAMGTQPYGCFVDLAEGIKEVVEVPVTAVGRILHPELAEQILESGKADLVAVGRGLIAEPDWPTKVEEGRVEDLRLCIMCNHCAGSLISGRPLSCAINAESGQVDAALQHAAVPKTVLVAGGGPAGMEAARVAALRGHRVTLVEQEDVLGGQLHICSAPVFKEEVGRLTEYLTHALETLAVDIRLSTKLTPEILDSVRPDAVIVATGAVPSPLKVPGTEDSGVAGAWAVLARQVEVGENVVVVGGGAVGIETALFLAEEKRRITVVEMLDKIGGQESPTMMPFIERRIREENMRILTGHKVVELGRGAVVVESGDGEVETLACDTIVDAVGTRRNAVLVEEIEERQIECHLAGDCSEESSGNIADAIHGGFRVGAKV
jgi:2,4-dienoyl-CoA reductase-like NADH-dependent reductase (Old Yellow Enzyme family)/thioredoxin reductase